MPDNTTPLVEEYFNSQAHLNKWLRELTGSEQASIKAMLCEYAANVLEKLRSEMPEANTLQQCILEPGDEVMIHEWWGPHLGGRKGKVISVRSAWPTNCESGFLVKTDLYDGELDANWFEKILSSQRVIGTKEELIHEHNFVQHGLSVGKSGTHADLTMEYAKAQCMAFAEWIMLNEWVQYEIPEGWVQEDGDSTILTTAELYNKFLTETSI